MLSLSAAVQGTGQIVGLFQQFGQFRPFSAAAALLDIADRPAACRTAQNGFHVHFLVQLSCTDVPPVQPVFHGLGKQGIEH